MRFQIQTNPRGQYRIRHKTRLGWQNSTSEIFPTLELAKQAMNAVLLKTAPQGWQTVQEWRVVPPGAPQWHDGLLVGAGILLAGMIAMAITWYLS